MVAAAGFRIVGTPTLGRGGQVAGQCEALPTLPASSKRRVEGLHLPEPAAIAERSQRAAAKLALQGGIR